MIELQTKRLVLREFAARDLDALAEMDAEPATRGFAWEGPLNLAAAMASLESWVAG